MRVRKRPIEVEAVPVADILADAADLPEWIRVAARHRNLVIRVDLPPDPPSVEIHTLEGVMRGEADDWIIRGAQGELYPIKPDIFASTYEPV